MFRTIEVPLWLFVLVILFALIAFFSHFLFPSVRWYFRRRMVRVVQRLNQRLERPIQPFKLLERHDMIVRLTHDPAVAAAVAEEAAHTGEPQTVVLERARRYAREIVPAFSASVYFGFGIRAARWFARLIYRVRVDDSALGPIDPKAAVVFVINHRSNMDYLLVTYLAASRTTLSYAVGEWARIWPLSGLIRTMGAYFIRRRSERPLYRRVLSRYVQMATSEGVAQAIFPEGGLSLSGETMPPRLGILSYIVSAERAPGHDVLFVPVAINYDRVVEDRVLVSAHAAGVRRFRAPLGQIAAFVTRHLWRALLGRFRGFGDAAVTFGTAVSLDAFCKGRTGDITGDLAAHLMAEITRHIPVLSVPTVAAAWGPDAVTTRADLIEKVSALRARLAAQGAQMATPEVTAEMAVDRALAIFQIRRFIRRDDDTLTLNELYRPILDFYAASILQIENATAARFRPEKRRISGQGAVSPKTAAT